MDLVDYHFILRGATDMGIMFNIMGASHCATLHSLKIPLKWVVWFDLHNNKMSSTDHY